MEVIIKVSFTMGYSHEDMSPILHPDLARQLIDFLKEKGLSKVKVIDVRTLYSNFYENRTVQKVADYFNYDKDIEIIDGSEDLVEHEYKRGIGVYHICGAWRNADFRISFGKLKSHPTEIAMLTIANLEWLGGNCEDGA